MASVTNRASQAAPGALLDIRPASDAGAVAAPRRGAGRYRELDSLRGLAALTVVFHHCLLIFPSIAAGRGGLAGVAVHSPLHDLFAGHEAVILFFVLSGFVLALPFVGGRPQSYATFMTRRFWRLYPPYAVAVLLAIVARNVFAGPAPAGLSGWFRSVWSMPQTATNVGKTFSLVASFNDRLYDPVLWSLTHEMRVSLVFPLIVLAVIRLDWKVVLAAAMFLSGATWVAITAVGHGQTLITFHYVLLFVVGALLAKHLEDAARAYGRLRRGGRIALLVVALCLYPFAWLAPGAPFHKGPIDDWVTGAAVVVLLITALHAATAKRFLLHRIPVLLGSTSYSLYLIHVVVLLSVVHALYGHAPTALLLGFVVAASIAVGYVLLRAVERPSQAFGRRITARSRAAAS